MAFTICAKTGYKYGYILAIWVISDLCGIYDLTNLLTGAVQIVCGVFDYLSYESRYRGY